MRRPQLSDRLLTRVTMRSRFVPDRDGDVPSLWRGRTGVA